MLVRRLASGLLGMPVRRQFAVMGMPWLLALAVGLAGITLGAAAAASFVAALAVLIVTTLTLALTPTTVRVGREGVAIAWLFQRRFVAFSSIASVATYLDVGYGKESRGIALTLHDGTVVRLATGADEAARPLAEALCEDVTEGLTRVDASPPSLPDALLRPAETPARRGAALRHLVHAEDLRTNAVPLERLLRIVESDGASAVERASAAAAAAASGDPSARDRIRIVSETTSFPELHAFLVRVVDADASIAEDEALATELDALERRKRRR